MSVHEQLGDKASQIETLSKSVLYLLARPSTPDEVRDDAIERAEGGFEGWVESRLTMSRTTAYELLAVHEKFGSVRLADTLPRKVLYLLARESTPAEVRDEALEQVEAGERLTLAEVEPRFERLNGQDQTAFIISVNLVRN